MTNLFIVDNVKSMYYMAINIKIYGEILCLIRLKKINR